MHGFYNRILIVDANKHEFRISSTDEKTISTYLGGKGLCAQLLTNLNPPGIDPFDPENRIIFATGPLCNSGIFGASRYGVFTKSPQTGLFSQSYSGGHVPEAVDATGFDAVVISGKSEKPVILEIDPRGAMFHLAEDIWGMDTNDAEEKVHERFFDASFPKFGVVVIGPAGERKVRFSTIQNDRFHYAGRTGTGAVLGSKRIKSVVFKGDQRRPINNTDRTRQFIKKIAKIAKEDPGVAAYRRLGTPMMVKLTNNINAFPSKYWSQGKVDHFENISADALHRECKVTPKACAKCMIGCGRLTTVQKGRHKGLKLKGPEYETIYAFGGLCMVEQIEDIIYLNHLCNKLGLDTITTGNLCGFTIEAVKAKRVDFKVEYGNVDQIAVLVELIANREGIGEILSQGIRHAAKIWDFEERAVHVKGLEPAGFDPRVFKGMGLGYAVSERGACHLRATFYKPELSGLIPTDQIAGKAEMFVDYEERLTIFDTLILCRFFRDLYSWDELQEMVSAVMGLTSDKKALKKIAADTTTLIRRFNLREGMAPEMDSLPERFFKDPLETGELMALSDFEQMKKEYYRLRNWSDEGFPK